MSGTHGIGHTRMATESAVTTEGAHPFSTGADQCLVHNGSLANHNALRRKLRRDGVRIESENDTEVGAAYLTWRMQQGATLGEALESALPISTGSSPSSWAPRTGSASCATPSPASPPSWPKPTNTSPSAANTARW
jgi:glutamate synthase domain-containing protein 1